jgi:RNA polymerase sigma factor (sigma-70 family)
MSALETHDVYGIGAEEETARLFDAHSAEILAFCRHQLGSRADADDALQTTFLYVLRALRRGVVPEREAAWLTTIARNVCHTQRRTLGRRGPLATDLDLDRIALAEPEPDEAELLAALPAALAALPDSQRNAIVMREWLGLAPAEIATRLELTTAATNALLTRARHSLATALTAAVRSPVSALNVGLLAQVLRGCLKTLLGSAASKAATVTVVAAIASAGGIAVQQSLADDPPRPTVTPIADRAPPASAAATTSPTRSSKRRASASAPSRGNRLVDSTMATSSRRVAPTTSPTPAEPTIASPPLIPAVEPNGRDAPAAETREEGAVPDPGRVVPIPELPPLPDLSSGDPLLPPVEVPLPPPLPELPPVELPEPPVPPPPSLP